MKGWRDGGREGRKEGKMCRAERTEEQSVPVETGRCQSYRVLLRGRSRKTTEFSAAAAVVVVVQFLFWPPEDGATKADGRVSGGEVPGSQRDKDTHTPKDFVSIT